MVKYKRMLFEKIFSGGNTSRDMHTNQYAVGSVSRRTFAERKNIEQNRSRIASYRHSKLGASVNSRRNNYTAPADKSDDNDLSRTSSSGVGAAPGTPSQPPARSFQEPSTRGFNPYA